MIPILLLFLSTVAAAENDTPPEPVARVSLERYAGLWYEIAKIPNRFQKQCTGGTTAEYIVRADGRIDVINSCVTESGEVDRAKGLAKIVNTASNAELKVNFFRLLWMRLFWGDYWIIGLGENYEYSIVGTPDRKYGWILSRTPRLDDGVLENIYEQLRAQGYDPADFELTDQSVSASEAPSNR